MAIDRSAQLQRISQAMPVASERAAQQSASQQALQLQQAAMAAQGAATAAQQLGGQATLAQGQAALQQRQQQAQMQQRLQEQQVQERQRQLREREAQRRIGDLKQQRDYASQLASLDERSKNELLDMQLEFQQDEFGRTLFTERQIMDYAVMNAKSEIELQQFQDDLSRATRNYEIMLDTAMKKLQQELSRVQKLQQTKQVQDYSAQMARALHQLKKKQAQEMNKKRNRAAMMSGIGAVAGGVIGAFVAGPPGAMAGASIGGSTGTMVAAGSN